MPLLNALPKWEIRTFCSASGRAKSFNVLSCAPLLLATLLEDQPYVAHLAVQDLQSLCAACGVNSGEKSGGGFRKYYFGLR